MAKQIIQILEGLRFEHTQTQSVLSPTSAQKIETKITTTCDNIKKYLNQISNLLNLGHIVWSAATSYNLSQKRVKSCTSSEERVLVSTSTVFFLILTHDARGKPAIQMQTNQPTWAANYFLLFSASGQREMIGNSEIVFHLGQSNLLCYTSHFESQFPGNRRISTLIIDSNGRSHCREIVWFNSSHVNQAKSVCSHT